MAATTKEATTKEAGVSDVPVFDTRKYVRNLTHEGGISERQADAHANGLQEALRGVAKTSDIEVLRAEIGALRAETRAEIGALRAEMRAETGALRAEMRAETGALRAELKAIWKLLDAHQEQMRGLRQLMIISLSMNGGIILLLLAVLGLR